MAQLKENLLKSFALVKRDVMQLQEDVNQLQDKNEALTRMLRDAKAKDTQLNEKITRLKEKVSKTRNSAKAAAKPKAKKRGKK